MKTISSCNNIKIRKILFLLFVILFSLGSWFSINHKSLKKGYSVFIEFNHAYGIKPGSPVRLRGLPVGSVVQISNELNSVVVLVKFHSVSLIIPRNSIIEASQTGLLNDSVVDIIPIGSVVSSNGINNVLNPLASDCNHEHIFCHLSYVTGDRGLNYDDLIRATTRISQRFDDPRFFNLFYMFLHNSVEITDYFAEALVDLSEYVNLFSGNFLCQNGS
uniref:Mce/MlaD domain-containing protein n=1 Tax=Izziella formosana TaxID=1653389 RepID=A0A1G4NUP0_9FLOR|nr:Hypothetical protein ycf22 [Izziella formosana]SCW22324.1 Hypothetical protein ycf22 [Izziella formosana]